jgi:hypothetical protein
MRHVCVRLAQSYVHLQRIGLEVPTLAPNRERHLDAQWRQNRLSTIETTRRGISIMLMQLYGLIVAP